jgi:hypothetical protein
MPFAGFPTILVGLKGSWVVCTWPMTAQVAAGGKVTDFNALIEGMKPMEVVTFMEKWRSAQPYTESRCRQWTKFLHKKAPASENAEAW